MLKSITFNPDTGEYTLVMQGYPPASLPHAKSGNKDDMIVNKIALTTGGFIATPIIIQVDGKPQPVRVSVTGIVSCDPIPLPPKPEKEKKGWQKQTA